jgi:aminopeptidase-like protein
MMPTPVGERLRGFDPLTVGAAMHDFIAEAYPICRSITGDGVRQTLAMLGERIPLQIHEVPTSTPAFDWTVPKEWNIRDAWIKDPRGEKVVDFRRSNLHVLNYSVPVHEKLPLEELRKHLFTLPDQPDRIPYRTSYYREAWGFCLSHHQLLSLQEGEYEVFIDSTLADGSLTSGECFLPGETEREVLISCHVCHPSLANDNLSGIAVSTFLARELAGLLLRYSYRFVFIPGTVGSIVWLSRNEERTARIAHGLVAANLGDPGHFHYKRSRRWRAEIDRVVTQVLQDSGEEHRITDFIPFGYDERQYCSPGFDLPVGSLTRTPYGRYPEYHTSADNLDFVRPEALAGSLRTYLAVVDVLEGNGRFLNLNPKCEPQLGRRGLYRTLGGDERGREREMALLWVLNLSDGQNTLLDIADRSEMPFAAVREACEALLAAGLLRELGPGEEPCQR